MNKDKLINILKYSAILGAVLGLIGAIPYFYIFSALVLNLLSAVLVIVYMQKKQQIGDLTIKGASIVGAVIGIVSLSAFLAVN